MKLVHTYRIKYREKKKVFCGVCFLYLVESKVISFTNLCDIVIIIIMVDIYCNVVML